MEFITSNFINNIAESGCLYFIGFPMSEITTFKIGGNADILLEPQNLTQLKQVLIACKAHSVPYIVMGNGSNMLVSDKGIRGTVIHLGAKFADIRLAGENMIFASAGVSLSKLSSFAMENSLTGLEFSFGIPGNVGGGLFMNAGAYGGELKNITEAIYHLDDALAEGEYTPQQADMRYRHTIYHENDYVITGGLFSLSIGDKEQIRKRMTDLMNQRSSKQPLELPSAGSTFKRPQGAYAAALIDQCGLKGRTVGGAAVSTKHSGFIVNIGNATCSDVLELASIVEQVVLDQTGYVLELEPKVIGEK